METNWFRVFLALLVLWSVITPYSPSTVHQTQRSSCSSRILTGDAQAQERFIVSEYNGDDNTVDCDMCHPCKTIGRAFALASSSGTFDLSYP
jgi:hypothetical protein